MKRKPMATRHPIDNRPPMATRKKDRTLAVLSGLFVVMLCLTVWMG